MGPRPQSAVPTPRSVDLLPQRRDPTRQSVDPTPRSVDPLRSRRFFLSTPPHTPPASCACLNRSLLPEPHPTIAIGLDVVLFLLEVLLRRTPDLSDHALSRAGQCVFRREQGSPRR